MEARYEEKLEDQVANNKTGPLKQQIADLKQQINEMGIRGGFLRDQLHKANLRHGESQAEKNAAFQKSLRASTTGRSF